MLQLCKYVCQNIASHELNMLYKLWLYQYAAYIS